MADHEHLLSKRFPHDDWNAAMPPSTGISMESVADMALAASGLKAVLRTAVASGVEEDCEPGYPLSPGHVSGLMDAAQALAVMLNDGLFRMGEGLERQADGESERTGVRHVWKMVLVPVSEGTRHD